MIEYNNPGQEMDDVLFRCLEGTASDTEYEHAWRWVHHSPQNKKYYSNLRDAWIAADMLKPVDTNKQRQVWEKLEKEIRTPKRAIRINYVKWAAVAAIVIVAYLVGTKTSSQFENQAIAESTFVIEAPKGGKSVMTLRDRKSVV